LTISSLNLPIAASNSVLGIAPASESLLAFTITMNRISSSVLVSFPGRQLPARLNKTNGVSWRRHGNKDYFRM
jgi:hypothetical protein